MSVVHLSQHRSASSTSRVRQRLCMRCGEAPAAREIRRTYAWAPSAARALFLLGAPGMLLLDRACARHELVFDTCLRCDANAPRRAGDVTCLGMSVALHAVGVWLIWGHPAVGLLLLAVAFALACRAVSVPPDVHVVAGAGGHRLLSLHPGPAPTGGDVPLFLPHVSTYRIPLNRCDHCAHINWTHYGVCMRCHRPLDGRRTHWIEAA